MGTPGVPINISKSEIIAALKANKGQTIRTCKALNIHHCTLYKLIKADPELQDLQHALRHEYDDILLDQSEDNLLHFLENRDAQPDHCLKSTFYVLNTKGAQRGYLPAEVAAAKESASKDDQLRSKLDDLELSAELQVRQRISPDALKAAIKRALATLDKSVLGVQGESSGEAQSETT